MDPASAVIGAVSFLMAFKGAVDGYTMLADIFASDPGLNYEALLYNIEQIIFQTWGERIKISDSKECLLNKEPLIIQEAIGRIIAEIVATNDKASEWIAKKYKVDPIASQQIKSNAAVSTTKDFNVNSPWIAGLKDQRYKLKRSHRITWVMDDKKHFQQMNHKLATLNQKLHNLVGAYNETRLITAISDKLDPRLSLKTLSAGGTQESPTLLGLVSRLHSVQEEDVEIASARVQSIAAECIVHLEDINENGSIQRTLASYHPKAQLPETILLEWKYFDVGNHDQSELIKRLRALGTLLSSGNAQEFHRLDCFGIFDDKDYEKRSKGSRRIALAYKLPRSPMLPQQPICLLDILKTAKKDRTRPPLGKRFELAYKLASAMSLFHAAKWLHKSFRSDCIIFPGGADSITEPAIVGFQYSRPASDASLETTSSLVHSELQVYIHPSVGTGWTKAKEIYSLGVVLLEIAYWRSVFEGKYLKMTASDVAVALKGEVDGKFGQDLEGTVGEMLMSAK
ncbi:hypothetical protein NW762_009029 [Fusarium torreyae]|uniref:Prion-inhibition and propagation HeLo domain-containing protein n=1 Tax=Fusarium torreyae TaxID=1237075 RepID=A0A9W8RYK2_9HYPO|nr:hypothetical protein NW762_009029 [Fusarium torreyae]